MDDVERVRAGSESPEARIAATADAQFGVFSRRHELDAVSVEHERGYPGRSRLRRAIMPG
jgi:hypothetical protein